MEEISFIHFFMELKSQLNQDFLKSLNPYTQKFFKSKECYIALSFDSFSENLHVDLMIGKANLTIFQAIRGMAIKVGAKTITWITSENNSRVNKISKFYRCQKTEIDRFYADGSKGIVWVKSL